MEERFQRLEQWVEELLKALTDHIAALSASGNTPRRRPILPRFPERGGGVG